MPKSTKKPTTTKRVTRKVVSTRKVVQSDRRVALLRREQGATRFQTRRAMGYDDGRATTYPKIQELARLHGYRVEILGENARGEELYRFVARGTKKPVAKKASASE